MQYQELEVLQKFEAIRALFQKVDPRLRVALVRWWLAIIVIVLGLRLLGAAL